MYLSNFTDIMLEDVNIEGAKGAKIRWLISEKEGATNFAMRMFEVAPNGNTPYHTHNYEHEVFVLEGEGDIVTKDGAKLMKHGDAIYVAPNEEHQFVNKSEKKLVFLCLIPQENKKTKTTNPFASGKANTC